VSLIEKLERPEQVRRIDDVVAASKRFPVSIVGDEGEESVESGVECRCRSATPFRFQQVCAVVGNGFRIS
jgi:hypothetical protein